MRCDFCGAEEAMPFRCRYCEGDFCSLHRLPPTHECARLRDFMEQPARNREFLERVRGRSGSSQERVTASLKNAIMLRFSKEEVAHLAIATALVTGVGLSLFNYRFEWEFLAIFISAFIVHELGHKFLAQIYHAWAEFRVLFYGAAMTLISALPFFPFKFIAPGAVWVSGNLTRGRSGRVSWIGPLTNLAMGLGFLIAYMIGSELGASAQIFAIGVRFNGWIALFNMIPFMGLDGQKIFAWNKIVWILTMAASVGLYIVGEMISGGGLLSRFFR
jgi:Zn-dependent protease